LIVRGQNRVATSEKGGVALPFSAYFTINHLLNIHSMLCL
jgi:hypothetical protein